MYSYHVIVNSLDAIPHQIQKGLAMSDDYTIYIETLADDTGLDFNDALQLAEMLEDCANGY